LPLLTRGLPTLTIWNPARVCPVLGGSP